MANQRFALLTSGLGLLLCSAQTFKGHIDSRHERDRMQARIQPRSRSDRPLIREQEMHEQKMHYLHEFHRREIHAKDQRLGALEKERKRMGRRVDEEGRVWLLLQGAREDGGDESRLSEEMEKAVEGKEEEAAKTEALASS